MNENEIRASKRIINKKFFIINDNPKYSLKVYHLIEKINTTKDEASEEKDNKYILNILLMSSQLSDSNRLACLLLLYYLYRKEGTNQDLINYLYFKICKFYIKFQNSEDEIIQKFLKFPILGNFLYSMEYLSAIKKIFISDKNLDKNYKTIMDTLEITTKEQINIYLEENFSKFNSFNLIPEEHLEKIENIIDESFKGCYSFNSQSSLYLISKIWLMKLKTFIEPYIVARKEQVVSLLCEGAFNYNKVYNYIYKQETFEKPLGVFFPGPINNLSLTHAKDFWYDPVNIEENDIIKNGLKYGEDFFLVNKDDYILLKSIFKDTNELRRKSFEEDIYKFKIVIIEPRLAEKEYKYLLKKRYLQININGDWKGLKNKIIRCLNYELDKNEEKKEKIKKDYYNKLYENNEVDFFVVNKQNKEILNELFISFVNKSKMYESLYIQQIKFNVNQNSIKDLFNYYNEKTQILLAEIIPKNCYSFIRPIISEHKNPNIYNCCVCGERFNLKEKYNCKLCNLSLFCSLECAKISGEHLNLHEVLDKYYMKNFEIKNFLSEKIELKLYKENVKEIIPFNKDKINNYSAINSIIHCFFNSTDLSKYFLKKKYLNDLNIADYLLNKNTLVYYYNNLIDKMWKNDSKENMEIGHKNFLNFLIKKLDYDIDDKSSLNNVREIISFILINFHKELKRTNNPKLIKSKEESIISDLFQGIYQTTFSCSKCGNVSIIYDFFNYLLLSIPKKNSNLIIKYFSEYDCKDIHYTIDDNSEIKELKDKALNFLSEKINQIVQMMSVTDLIEITAFDTDDEKILTEVAMYNSLELVQLDKNKIVNKVYLTDKKDINKENQENPEDNNDNIESDLKLQINKIYKDSDIELVFYEKNVFEEPCINIYIYPFNYNENDKLSISKDKLYHVYPIAISAKLTLVLENFEYYVNVKLRSLLMDYYKEESENRKVNYIELVYPHFFCNNAQYSSTTCFLCKERTKTSLFCPLLSSIDKDLSIKDLIQKFDYPKQPIILLAKSKFFDTNKKYYSNISCFFNKRESMKKPENKLDLYNCFQLYTKKETLYDIDWFCEGCNSMQICEKQLSIYNLPIYLIIQIDRFAIKKINNKNTVDNTYLSIPINNLDLTKFVEGPDKNKVNYNYNLYAIIYKDISSKNEFTYCNCKNGNKWILFKDNKISIANELINKNVHFLFYKREDAQQ